MSNIKKICPNCNKEFSARRNKQIFCSKPCSKAKTKNGETKKCVICGNEFYVKGTQLRRGKSECCSKKCRGIQWGKILAERLKGVPVKWYAQGRKYEYKAQNELKNEGCFITTRSPGSKGIFDVFGIKILDDNVCLYLVQVKALKKTSTVNRALPRQERAALIKSIQSNKFPVWFGGVKTSGKPGWTSQLLVELWIWEKRVGWHKFRLNLETYLWEVRGKEPELVELEK